MIRPEAKHLEALGRCSPSFCRLSVFARFFQASERRGQTARRGQAQLRRDYPWTQDSASLARGSRQFDHPTISAAKIRPVFCDGRDFFNDLT
jgi:hypothetical protein